MGVGGNSGNVAEEEESFIFVEFRVRGVVVDIDSIAVATVTTVTTRSLDEGIGYGDCEEFEGSSVVYASLFKEER
jgi:hypothetical protein